MALGAMKIARQMGRRIPEDLAIVGFDDIPEAPYFDPALSAIRQDLIELGREGVRQLINMIDDPDASMELVRLQPELLVRESS
ncbi:MAG: substrate-binding domain-containing protein [Chloroflexi bacterium]|nr:substrate-binding domain-containing protein [Chloroflexota bacterium]